MQFLSNWTINVTKIPTYVEFNQDFVENVDYDLANIILEEKDESIAQESLAYFSNLVACIDKNKNESKMLKKSGRNFQLSCQVVSHKHRCAWP